MPSKRRASAVSCPLCSKPRAEEYRPFCSRGCRDRDLNRWFGEDYRVAAEEPPEGLSPDAEEG